MERCAFISDVHGNLFALEKILSRIHRMGAEAIFFLGDSIGYFNGLAAAERLISEGVIPLKGNHEAMLLDFAAQVAATGSFAAAPKQNGPYGDYLCGISENALGAVLDAIRDWPISRRITLNGNDMLLVHGSPADPLSGYIYEDAVGAEHQPPLGVHTVFCGHTHRPYILDWRHNSATEAPFATFANCGSVGLPRDDARFGSFLYWDSQGQTQLTLYRVNIEQETAKSLVRFGASDITKKHISTRRSEKINGTILKG